ncbi:MAG: zinc-ribbon domain-containing protein [Promethearchaeota archaeon]
MYCTNCGSEIPDDAKFCTYCGSKIHQSITPPIQPSQPPHPYQGTPITPQPRPSRTGGGAVAAVIIVVLIGILLMTSGVYFIPIYPSTGITLLIIAIIIILCIACSCCSMGRHRRGGGYVGGGCDCGDCDCGDCDCSGS